MTIIYDMPAADYHAHPAISKSGLDKVARSPAHFRYAEQREETSAMRIGTATHTAILEPARYRSEYLVVSAAKDRRCKAWNEAAAENDTGSDGDPYMLTGPEGLRVKTMADAVRGNPDIGPILALPGKSEVSVFAADPATGLQVRIRIDWLAGLHALDLKTTADLRNDKFSRSVFDYRYHVQEAFYRDVFMWATGEKLQRFDFALTESDVPHVSKLIDLPDEVVAYGRMLYRRDLNLYAQCLERDVWPGPEPEIRTLITPQWATYKMEDEIGNMIGESA